jgi:hypothetical protein
VSEENELIVLLLPILRYAKPMLICIIRLVRKYSHSIIECFFVVIIEPERLRRRQKIMTHCMVARHKWNSRILRKKEW